MDKLERILPHLFLVFCGVIFAIFPGPASCSALAIAATLWVCAVLIPRIHPLDKPTELEEKLKAFEGKLALHEQIIQSNADYSAKEFNSLKAVLHIKQMGR